MSHRSHLTPCPYCGGTGHAESIPGYKLPGADTANQLDRLLDDPVLGIKSRSDSRKGYSPAYAEAIEDSLQEAGLFS